MVYFSNVVLAPLVAATKGGSAEDKKESAMQEMAALMAEARQKEEEENAASTSGVHLFYHSFVGSVVGNICMFLLCDTLQRSLKIPSGVSHCGVDSLYP